MSKGKRYLLLVFGACAMLAGAGPGADADRLPRDGYAAFQRGDLALAATLYERAAERTTDPALLAFDLAGVQYRLAIATDDLRLLADAEQNYRCCIEPADPRRAAALYGLGTCLLARARGRDVRALSEALGAFTQCSRLPNLPVDLADAASHNQQAARLAFIQARAVRAAASDEPIPNERPDARQPRQPLTPENPSIEPGDRAPGNPSGSGDPTSLNGEDGKNARDTDKDAPPGKGSLPPIPEDDQATPLSPRDAAAHLDQAAARVRAERQRALRSRATRPALPGVRDW